MAEVAEGEWRWLAGFAPINREQPPLVIAGYTLGARNFDAIIFGYYAGGKLMYAGRTRSGFTPASRDQLFKRFQSLAAAECPFANLPQPRGGRWGEGLTAERMKECRWLKPVLVGQFEFVEWTPDGHPAALPLYRPPRGPEADGRKAEDSDHRRTLIRGRPTDSANALAVNVGSRLLPASSETCMSGISLDGWRRSHADSRE